MKKIYLSGLMMLTGLFIALGVIAQPYEATIIVVGGTATEDGAREEDSVLIDSVAQWVTDVIYMGQEDFNTTSADDLYGEDRDQVDGVIISESIGSDGVGNFGVRDNYPVPCVTLEMAIFTNDQASENKWPLLTETGGIWGYGSPDPIDMEWTIADDQHYITEGYTANDVIAYTTTESPSYGVPYLQGIAPGHQILITAAREDGGDVEGYNKSQAGALIYINDPEMVVMNPAHAYYPEGTDDFYRILRRSAEFVFGYIPDETGIADHTASINLNVYPNPATDQVNMGFKAQSNTNAIATVYDVAGNEVATFNQATVVGNNNMEINTTEFNSGVYIIKLEIEDQVGYSKVLVK